MGLNSGGSALAMTLAFATLTLARLFHGFNCRGRQSIFTLGFLSNKASLAAFCAGIVLLAAVLIAAVVLLVRALVRRKRSGRYGGYRRRRFFK